METEGQNVSSQVPPVNPPPTNAPPATPPLGSPPRADHNLEMLCHVLAFAGFVFPFGNVIAPLILWLIKRETYPGVDAHGKESLNFQISMSIWTILAGISLFAVIGILLLPAIVIANIILVIVASIKASNGEFYRYPLTIRFLK